MIYIFRSLGLAIPPRIRFLQRMEQKRQLSNNNTEEKKPLTVNNELNDINEEINDCKDDEREIKSQSMNSIDFTLGIKINVDLWNYLFLLNECISFFV